jgi:hypothetical protein
MEGFMTIQYGPAGIYMAHQFYTAGGEGAGFPFPFSPGGGGICQLSGPSPAICTAIYYHVSQMYEEKGTINPLLFHYRALLLVTRCYSTLYIVPTVLYLFVHYVQYYSCYRTGC